MKVVIDAFGGDNSPEQIVKGAVDAINLQNDLNIVLVGKIKNINQELEKYNFNSSQVEVIDATEIIDNNESPAIAIRTKKNSSIVVAYDLLRTRDDIDALISAGSTGAVLAGAYFKLGRLKGVSRPALAPILPKLTPDGGHCILLDSGANADCKPQNLVDFAIMGDSFAKAFLDIKNPKVGLLNIGAEEHKGLDLQKNTYEMLKNMDNINFIGNIEARYILKGDCDVVVCDGFSGNVALKSLEGSALGIFKVLKNKILKGGLKAKIGALLLKDTFKDLKKSLDYSEVGGAVFLGVKKIVVKAHGSSDSKAITSAIMQARKLKENEIIENIKSNLENNVIAK